VITDDHDGRRLGHVADVIEMSASRHPDHPAVAPAAVVAAPRVEGEAPVAFVVPEAGADVDETGLREFAIESVPTSAHPPTGLLRRGAPRSATRKVQRFELEDEAAGRIDGKLGSTQRL
jgi:long-chain acyl-CoA synthetase